MPTIMPHGELLRKALLYVDERLQTEPGASVGAVLDEAGARFNLSPRDGEALFALFREARAQRREGVPSAASADRHGEPAVGAGRAGPRSGNELSTCAASDSECRTGRATERHGEESAAP